MAVGTGKETKIGIGLNSSDWETGGAETLGANSGILLEDAPLVESRGIKSSTPLGAPRPVNWIRLANQLGTDVNKKFRFGGKMHQLFAGAMGVVETVSYRDLTKIVTGTATGGSTTTLVDSGAPFGSDDDQIGRYLIINSGTGAYQVALITDSTSTTLTFAAMTAPASGSVYEVVDFAPAIYDICSGTATANTIQISTQTSMGTNDHAGKWITIIEGTGVGQTRGITSNTADTFTVDADWATTPDATSKVDVMDSACTHIYAIGSTQGYYFTKAIYHPGYTKEIPHLKIGGFQISGVYDDFIMLRFATIGDKEVIPATVNTDQTLWTIRTQDGEIPLKKTTGQLLMNRASLGALSAAGTDNRKLSEFTFMFEQNIEGVLRTGPGTDNIKSEPIQNAHPDISLNFTEPLTETSLLKAERAADKAQKAKLTLTGSAITTNQSNELIINMPNIALDEVSDPINDAGFVPTNITSKLFDAGSAPSGMTYTDAFKLEITDAYGGNPLQPGNT